MAKVPQPRKPGQTGGGGRQGQAGNRSRSQDRGGRPHAGGGGSGKKPGSSTGSKAMVWVAVAIWSPFVASAVGAVVWVVAKS